LCDEIKTAAKDRYRWHAQQRSGATKRANDCRRIVFLMKPLNEDRSSRENQPMHVMPDFTAFLVFP
jgi:hypothetical protein